MGNKFIITHFCSDKTSKKILDGTILFLGFLLVMRDIMHIPINKFMLVAVAGFGGFFMNIFNLVSLISFLVPLSCGIPGNYIFMVLTLLYVFKRPVLSAYHVVFSFIVIAQEILLSFLAPSSNMIELMAYCFKIFLTFGIIFDDRDEHIREHLIAFVIGVTFLLVMILAITLQLVDAEKIMSGEFRLGETKIKGMTSIQLGTNSNTIGFYSLLAVSVCLILMKFTHEFKWIYIPVIAINIFIGFFSVSRSYIIFLALILIYYVFTSYKMTIRSTVTMIIAIVAFSFFIVYIYENTEIFEAYKLRFEDSTAETGGGRTNIFKLYYDWQTNNAFYLLFGAGALNHASLSGFASPHNALQQLLVSYGIIGFIVMIAVLGFCVNQSTKGIKKPKLVYMPFIATVLFLQTLQFLYPTEYFMALIYGYMSIRLLNDKNTLVNDLEHQDLEV